TNTAPVVVNNDEALTKGVQDATKDFPDVKATVNDGVITLNGSIEKSRYITLKQSLDGLHPKQVINNLNYK
ncbi:MAG: BON domain-containing protein, partial [Bacteroidota bacterium]|nr:BON domain-containing protein [Bacteroidota bacterium]